MSKLPDVVGEMNDIPLDMVIKYLMNERQQTVSKLVADKDVLLAELAAERDLYRTAVELSADLNTRLHDAHRREYLLKIEAENLRKRAETNWPLFRLGLFTLHSGAIEHWKIDCDSLRDSDLQALGTLIIQKFSSPFGAVEGIPTGGTRIAEMLQEHARPHFSSTTLIVDDVLTTGASMEEQRAGRENVLGVVLFSRMSRDLVPDWIHPVFQLW